MARPLLYAAKVVAKKTSTPKVTKLTLEYIEPSDMVFEPGKFVNLRCPNGKYRAYSIASDYNDTTSLDLLIETGHDGLGSNYVRELNLDDEVEIIGPSGLFTLRNPLPDHLIFYATGTGIAPFYAMFYKLRDLNYQGKIDVYFGVRSKDLIIEPETLEKFKKEINNFDFQIYLSRDNSLPEGNIYKAGRVNQALEYATDFAAQYYICGHPDMVDYVSEQLTQKGIPEHNIIVEGFVHSHS